MSPGVRRRIIGALVVAVTCPVCAHPQAPLTATDSAILASQPLKRLVLAPSLLRRVSLLAAGLDRAVGLCLQGRVTGDSAPVDDFVMPDPGGSTADQGHPLPCGRATLAAWHNHPWTGPDSTFR